MSGAKIGSLELMNFIKTYLSTIRRFLSILPDKRKDLLPDFWRFPHKILATICNDGIVIEFKRRIKGKQDSIKMSRRRTINDVNPKFTGDEIILPIDGASNIVVADLAIATKSSMPYLKPGGTLWKIPDNFGLFRLTSGGDIKFKNVGLFYVDKKGIPRQCTFKGLWAIANDMPSKFTIGAAKKRALLEFVDSLVKSAEIVGEKRKRYIEIDIASQIDHIKKDYLSLICSESIEELEVQKFLEKHKFILSPLYLEISPKKIDVKPQARLPAIKRIVDFLLMQEPNLLEYKITCTAVEIKKPSDKLFLQNGEMSIPLKEGIDQIDRIFEFARSNQEEAKKLMLISSISDLRGMVLIGRRHELSEQDLKRLDETNRTNPFLKVETYDDLLKNIECVKRIYGKKLRQPAVVVGQAGTEDEDFTGKTGKVIQEALGFLSKRIQEQS